MQAASSSSSSSFLPDSDVIYQRRNEQGIKEDYYTALLEKTTTTTLTDRNHSIVVGDICAIRDDEQGTKSKPFSNHAGGKNNDKNCKSILGQVLALFVKREGPGRNTFHVVVRRLARWKTEAPNHFAEKGALKQAEKAGYFRPDQALLETMRVDTYPVSQVLRADIRITDVKEFIETDRVEAEFDEATDSWHVSLCCPFRVDEEQKFHDVRVDWKQYEEVRRRRTTTMTDNNNNSNVSNTQPPRALVRGWELLSHNKDLQAALQSKWEARTNAVFYTKPEVLQEACPQPVPENATAKTTRKRKSSPVEVPQQQKTSLRSVPSKKQKKTNQRVHFEQQDTKLSSVATPETATDDTSESLNDVDDDDDEVSLRPTPLGSPVFTISKKLGTVYIEGVEMDVNEVALAPRKKKKMKQRWAFGVGDLIIVRCADASPPKKPFVTKKPAWYPFKVGWSVAQVVSMYYRTGKEADIKMEVRWFYRPDELNGAVREQLTDKQREQFFDGELQSRMLVEVDEHVNEASVESAIGLAKLTSELKPSAQWLQPKYTDAVPEMGFICRYAYISKSDDPRLYLVRDWTHYGAQSSGPLYRGLSCPKCETGKKPKLYKRYKDRLCEKLKINELQVCDLANEEQDTKRLVKQWLKSEFECAKSSCKPADCCHGDKQREFFSSVSIEIVKARCDARGTAKKSEYQEIKVSIGDYVCATNSFDDAVPKNIANEKNPWFPYKGPFIYVQVLSIFTKSGAPKNAVMLEVRRFFRRSEVTSDLQKYLPPNRDRQNEEEVFESYEVDIIPAGRVLGFAEMYLGHHLESCRTLSTGKSLLNTEIPQPKCRCTFFLTETAMQKIFCADSTPLKWARRILQRGLTASKLIRNDTELAASIEYCMGISISPGDKKSNNLFLGLINEARKAVPMSVPLFRKVNGEGSEISYYSSVNIEIPWSSYLDGGRLCSVRDRKDCWWKICVGGVVAVRKEGSSGRSSLYTCDWEAAQILAIRSSGEKEGNYDFVVQYLRRLGTTGSRDSFPGRISDSIGLSTSAISSEDLLGPVYVAKEDTIPFIWNDAIPYLPTNVVIYEGMKRFSFASFVRKGLQSLNVYTDEELRLLYDALDDELFGFTKGELSVDSISQSPASVASEEVLSTVEGLFHIDRNGVRYYRRLLVEPSLLHFVEEVRGERERDDAPWAIELGDSVVVGYSHGCGKAKFGGYTFKKSRKHWPLEEPWAVGEVVSIFAPSKIDNSGENSTEVEIRWYYRANEIKGGIEALGETSDKFCEEIFESDHYDTCSVSSLRSPAIVHQKSTLRGKGHFHKGVPVLEFVSCRFWSPRRSSLVPIENAVSARVQRGRLNSPRIMHDGGLRKALEALGGCQPKNSPSQRKPWQSNFHDAIQKLSLTDASKEGFKCSKAIIGREKEMKQILSFLRTHLKGTDDEGPSSLFIAGPPGVGKTACVRAAISELEELRSKAQVPTFDFVCMNGMEMRQPFEAYVQLWEKISGITARPEVAVTKLEAYFTSDDSVAVKEAKSDARAVVVLLDEIDYLVTKTQSVLYNFFDWPSHNQKRRLIVLGVSNTLNLAEQLHTRVQSRIGSRRCIFKAYDVKQIESILRAKLLQATPGQKVFDEDAITYVSKKTASLSGDIRRAFQICRAAAEHVMRGQNNVPNTSTDDAATEDDDPIVTIRDAVKVSQDSFNSAKSQAIARCSSFEALLLVSLASLSRSTGREFGGFDMEEILVKMEALANGLGDPRYLPAPTLSEAMHVVGRLAEGNIVSVLTPKSTSLTYRSSLAGSGGPWPLVSLTVDDLAVFLALKKGRVHYPLAQKYLGLFK